MRRRLKTLKAKSGHSQNGAPRQMIDEATYRERRNAFNAVVNGHNQQSTWDPKFSGWSNPSRPRDFAISLRTAVSRNPS